MLQIIILSAFRKGRDSVTASASGEGCPEAMPLAAGFGGGSRAPKMAKAAEPLPVQPGDGVRVVSILVGHGNGDGRFRLVYIEGATKGHQLNEARSAVGVAHVEHKGQMTLAGSCAADGMT